MTARNLLLGAAAAALAVQPLAAKDPAPPSAPVAASWQVEDSDIPLDPAFRLGVLPNGMRYAVVHNALPKGTALVRMWFGSGSLSEADSEQGLAHFLEHMVFNGSKRIPEGEMIKLLERNGLQFGADTNAYTTLDHTLYKLDLPENDPALLNTALMLMRETASELTIDPGAVDRERGVVLSERRDGLTFARRELEDRWHFSAPGALFADRLPIGTLEVLEKGGAADIRGFYEREYVPANAALFVIGDFDPAMVEKEIRATFSDWSPAPDPKEPFAGPIDFARKGEARIFTDPALSERVTVFRNKPFVERPDTAAKRRQDLLAGIGYDIVNRRLAALARKESAPFRGAGYGTSDIFDAAQTTSLIVDTADGEWRVGFDAAVATLRQALAYGFSESEVAEQMAKRRTMQEDAASAAATRNNQQFAEQIVDLLNDQQVPSTPASSLARFNAFAPYVTPAAVLAALRQDAAPLDDPFIYFVGRKEPEGGVSELHKAWTIGSTAPVKPPAASASVPFAYTKFGAPGAVASDSVNARFGLRQVRFANGVMLTLKKTDLEKDRVRFRLSLDGGTLLDTREQPLNTAMLATLPVGGLGKHSQDELDSILAGRTVEFAVSAATDSFVLGGTTTPRDLDLQLELLAAAISDPGYRPEGNERYSRAVANFFANLDATPFRALGNAQGGILSDNDPRFTLQPRAAYEALSFDTLKAAISDRLAHGAIELALVGDLDEQRAIDFVARTLGAMPVREAQFQPRPEARVRSFTADRSRHIVTHTGEASQAIVQLVWPTRDDSDLGEDAELRLLDAVMQVKVQEELRERLGQTYSPGVNSATSEEYPGYGTFTISASVDVKDVAATRQAIDNAVAQIASAPVNQDLLDRARKPILEGFANRLKSLASWLSVADRAQSEADRLARFDAWPPAMEAITGEQLQQAAKRWLVDQKPVEILVVPKGNELANGMGG